MIRFLVMFILLLSMMAPAPSEGQAISGPEVRIANNDVLVTYSLSLEEKKIRELSLGVDKELRFHVDLFRVWRVWPDEFIIGKYYSISLKSDQIKKEYVAKTDDGSVVAKKRFKSLESMLEGTLSLSDFKLTNTRELEPGDYFVRITVESKTRKLPPVIGYFLVFISENEFKIKKDSSHFVIEGSR